MTCHVSRGRVDMAPARHILKRIPDHGPGIAIVDAKRALTFRVVQLRQPPQMRAQIPTLFTGWPDPLPVRKCTQVRSPSRLSLWVEMKPPGSMTRARFSQWSGSRYCAQGPEHARAQAKRWLSGPGLHRLLKDAAHAALGGADHRPACQFLTAAIASSASCLFTAQSTGVSKNVTRVGQRSILVLGLPSSAPADCNCS